MTEKDDLKAIGLKEEEPKEGIALDLSRQAKLMPVDIIEQTTLKVFGVGSVGSHFVKTAAKTGFTDIEVYDMDIVESDNIAAQAFDFEHINKNKVDAIADIVKRSSGAVIKTHHGEITKDTVIEPEPNTIYCCFFDSFETRKIVFDTLKDFPIVFVDARIGKYDMRHYLVNCAEAEHVKAYAATLEVKAVSELECGEKASAPINVQIAGMLVINIINYITGADYEKSYLGNAKQRSMDIRILEMREKAGDK